MAKRYTEEQIVAVLKEAEAGAKPAEICAVMVSRMPRFTSGSVMLPISQGHFLGEVALC
jgi:hypothetical protein